MDMEPPWWSLAEFSRVEQRTHLVSDGLLGAKYNSMMSLSFDSFTLILFCHLPEKSK